MRMLYTLLLHLGLPLALLRLIWRGIRSPGYLLRWGERLGRVPKTVAKGSIWVHAVSVGEVNAALPLARALRQYYPDQGLLMTTTTPTGSMQLTRSLGSGVDHCYLPYDYPWAIHAFLRRTRPQMAIIMETEIWPNLFKQLSDCDIPIVMANVRLSLRSYQGYRRIPGFVRETLSHVSLFAVQTRADAARLRKLGAPGQRLKITNSIKFDVHLAPSLSEVATVVRRDWGQERPVLVAGSTHDGEEARIISAYKRLLAENPDLLLVLAPRHPERFAAVTRLCRRARLRLEKRSEVKLVAEDTQIYLADSMGELPVFYAAADVALVGGSLIDGGGGHNVLEPCAVGVAVLFGPNMANFREISQQVLSCGAGFEVTTEDDIVTQIHRLLHDPEARFLAGEAGRALVKRNKGALQKTMDLIAEVLEDRT